MKVSATKFGRVFRGSILRGNVMHFTLRKFDERDEAELYALKLMMRYRAIFERDV